MISYEKTQQKHVHNISIYIYITLIIVVHYGKDLERDFKNKKHKMSRRAMCSYDIVPEYSVMTVIQEHQKHLDDIRTDDDILNQYKRTLSKWQLHQIYNQKCGALPSIIKHNRNNSL